MGSVYVNNKKDTNETNSIKIADDILQGKFNLSWDASALLIRSKLFKQGSEIDWNEFQKLYGITRERRLKALKELQDKGFCIIHKFKPSKSWIYRYYFFERPLTKIEQDKFILEIQGEDFET